VLGKRDIPSFHVSQVSLRKQSYHARARKLPPQFRRRRSRFPQIFNPREVINVAITRRAKSNPQVAASETFLPSVAERKSRVREISAWPILVILFAPTRESQGIEANTTRNRNKIINAESSGGRGAWNFQKFHLEPGKPLNYDLSEASWSLPFVRRGRSQKFAYCGNVVKLWAERREC